MFIVLFALIWFIISFEYLYTKYRFYKAQKEFYEEMTGEIDSEIVLELILASIKSGKSVQNALITVGRKIKHYNSDKLLITGNKLLLTGDWEKAWENFPDNDIKICLENSWHRGISPVATIEYYLSELSNTKAAKNKEIAEKVSVKIMAPLGLCFLPSFLCIGVVPILLALIAIAN
jgi:tight adherence protein B